MTSGSDHIFLGPKSFRRIPRNSSTNIDDSIESRDSNKTPDSASTKIILPPADSLTDAGHGSSSQWHRKDDQELQQAIEQSICVNRESERRGTAHNSVEHARIGLSNEFALISEPSGDVLIYIGAPPRMPGQTIADHAYISNHFRRLHRMQSSQIRSLESPRLNDVLGPRSIRAERRLRRDGVLGHYNTTGVNFFVDLRPPNEDEEAVILVTDLTCTYGVLAWHKAAGYFGIATDWVHGTDEFGKFSDIMGVQQPLAALDAQSSSRTSDAATTARTEDPTAERKALSPSDHAPLEAEYSPLRHRSAIERLLQAIAYNDPRLDSAPKVWTYFALAKYFQCATHERINGWITRWMLSGKNANFIQCNPEVSFQIGVGIKSSTITRDAFSILVGEKALIDVYSESDPTILSPLRRSVHGRQLALLDDDERNRIDHGAASLIRRVRGVFKGIVSNQMSWLHRSDAYKKLAELTGRDISEQQAIQGATQLVQDYIRGRIFWTLCLNHDSDSELTSLDMNRAPAFVPGHPPNFFTMYNILNQPMRLFTRTFWKHLAEDDLSAGSSNVCPFTFQQDWTHLGSAMQRQYHADPENGIKVISRAELDKAIGAVNIMLSRRHEKDCAILVQPSSHIASQPVQSDIDQAEQYGTGKPDHASKQLNASPSKRGKELGEETSSPSIRDKRRKLSDVADVPVEILRHEFELPLRISEKPGMSAELIRMLDPAGNELSTTAPHRTSREHALQLELFSVARYSNATPVAIENVKALFLEFEPVCHKFPSGTTPGYTDFRDRLAPDEGHFRVYNSYGRYLANVGQSRGLYSSAASSVQHGQQLLHSSAMREHALQLELVEVQKQFRRLNLTTGASARVAKDFFVDFQPIAQGLGEDLNYTDFKDKIFPGAEPIRVHNSFGQYLLPDMPLLASRQLQVHPYWGPPEDHIESHPLGLSVTSEASRHNSSTVSDPSEAEHPWYPAKSDAENFDDADMPHSSQSKHSIALAEPYPLRKQVDFSAQPYVPRFPTYIDLHRILSDANNALHAFCSQALYPAHLVHDSDATPVNLTDTLMCLDEDEWKYLPLWAGGCDDGTGGVFDEVDVPNLEKGGFRGGKRGIGRVNATSAASLDGSSVDSFSDIAGDVSTIGRASKDATDGTETIKSYSDISSDEDFMRQDDVFDEVMKIKQQSMVEQDQHRNGDPKGKGRETVPSTWHDLEDGTDDFDELNNSDDMEADRGTSTVRGAGSDIDLDEDIQGKLFGDIDDSEGDHDTAGHEAENHEKQSDSEDDLVVINMADL